MILALALGLRVWHLREGLPDFFEEAFPFRRAFEMAGWATGRTDWNPHAFHYPSLSFYLHLALQRIEYGIGHLLGAFRNPADFFVAYEVDPSPMALGARALGVAADLATIVAVARIGERLRRGAGLLAALLVAVSSVLIHQSRAIETDGLLTAFSVWALERMIVARVTGRATALVAAAVLTGLAAGTKYPAGLLVVPLAWSAWRGPSRGWRIPLALLGALLTFLVTSPYLLASAAEARFDLLRIADLVGQGQLGSFGRPSLLYYLRTFARDFGWLAPALLLASLAWLRRAPVAARGFTSVWLAMAAFAIPMLLGRVEFERYLAPVVPGAALLMAVAALALPDVVPRIGDGARVWLRAGLVMAIALPAALSGFAAAATGGDTTQARARADLEARVAPDQLLVQEAHGAPLRDRRDVQRVLSAPAFARADSSWRRRYAQLPVARAVRVPLLVAGRAVVLAQDARGRPHEIELFPSSADLDRVFYEPALYAGVDWMITSDAVRGRYEADPGRYRAQHLFYQLLDRTADSVTIIRSGGTVTGPEIRIYRLGARFHRATSSPLDPLWWTRDVPDRARVELERVMGAMGRPRADLDAPPTWVLGLGALFDKQIEPFAYPLALELADLGRCDPAMAMADAILRMDPGHVQATGIVATCAEAEGDLSRARDAIARLLAVRDPDARSLADIRLEYARLLAQTGARDEARRQLARVLLMPAGAGEAQQRARALLQALGGASTP
ncbi:MAG: phospholipid carrier-dependent glycosyltransferase [Candidatus Eisenbacteria bacterium]|uniref:Phospholipid carrier-dependent glycosyltransferase n=1 Tax=Eiseniibacteriota bacterium TaxID=2212470 RepID=A0A538U5P9_UNCEI|nr:MAG: phospholipid carrier-dependent glycosyltransferase [Candidatus Eisenbacteria bacterium]